MSKSVFQEEYKDESGSGKMSRKAKDSPFMVFGLVGLAAVCGIGAYKYNRRGGMSTSVFLMQLRVAAQGTVVGALSIGLAYTMAQRYMFHSAASDHSAAGALTPPPPAAATDGAAAKSAAASK